MAGLNATPSANRLHIGVFGKTNSGKSSFINAFTGQNVSVVADVAGTTTDPVYKAMEIHPIGPCVLIDTAGVGDTTELGRQRMEKTMLAAEKTEVAVFVLADDADDFAEELTLLKYFKEKKTPILVIANKADLRTEEENKAFLEKIQKKFGAEPLLISTQTGEGVSRIKEALARMVPEDANATTITGSLVKEDDVVLLVMPQDIQAPKGRLILPQVQTIRELLDKKCTVLCATTDKFLRTLDSLKQPPKLIIVDSQVFDFVYNNKPQESLLTSFSVLFAAQKGDIDYYVESAKKIDALTKDSKVLIAECCTHAPLTEDIGRVKIPNMLRKKYGESITVDIVSGTDYPQDLTKYDLIIQCGACMFNRAYVLSRIERAKEQGVPMTNYGTTIAYLTGILGKIVMP